MGELYGLDALRKFEFGEFFARKGTAEEERIQAKEQENKHQKEQEDDQQQRQRDHKEQKKKESEEEASRRLMEEGFDPIQHEQFRKDLQEGKIGLARNRLALSTKIEDVMDDEVLIYFEAQNAKGAINNDEGEIERRKQENAKSEEVGRAHITRGGTAVLTLAAGVGSRWTQGAAVIKALNPFLVVRGKHRNFLDLQIAKTVKTSMLFDGVKIPHVITTGFLTHDPIEKYVEELKANHEKEISEGKKKTPLPPIYLSQGKTVHQRLIPTVRDLQFLWEETSQEILPEMKQKVTSIFYFESSSSFSDYNTKGARHAKKCPDWMGTRERRGNRLLR